LDDLMDIGLPTADAPRSWNRSRGTLVNRSERLLGLAIAGGEHLDASLLYSQEDDGSKAIWSLSAAPGASGEAALGMLARPAHREGRLVIPKIDEDEVSLGVLPSWVLRGGGTIGVAADANRGLERFPDHRQCFVPIC
jgi:hypothetical protein